ncbi:MAG: helix-turn-helix transcriptional regulator [Thermaceae bacterium]|nr:helix-turn-helix transcriptional regulator [Thermaceae bacterium]
MNAPQTGGKRRYQMTARATAAAETERRILDATVDLYTTRDYEDITFEEIARRAKVAVPTLFRRFGSKEGLLEAASRHARQAVITQRDAGLPGDVRSAVGNLLEHYELWGDRVLRLLAQEHRVPAIRAITDQGRAVHWRWVEQTFGPLLPLEESARARRVSQLVAVCDVYVWKVFRRDLGLSREETALALIEIIEAL